MNDALEIPPLWERLPAAFAYGLRPHPLLLGLGLGLLSASLALFAGIWGQLIIYAVMSKYGFSVLQESAQGRLEPPDFGWSVIGEGYGLPVKYYLILLLYLLMLYSVGLKFGAAAVLLLMLVGVALLPAATMVLAQTESLLSAINPLLLVAMVGRIGWVYLVLLVFYLLLGVSQSVVTDWVGTAGSPYLVLFGLTVVGTYFIVVSFHMMGYVLLQAHESLGEETPEALRPDAAVLRLTLFDNFMQNGQTDAAIAELESLLRETPRDLGLHRRLHNLLLATGKTQQLATHTRRALPFLLELGHADMAAGYYCDCAGVTQDCAPRRADAYPKLALALRHRGQARQAALLVNSFNQQFASDDAARPALYLAAARILSEDLNQDAQARRLLEVLVKDYPGHPLTPEVESTLGALSRLGAGR